MIELVIVTRIGIHGIAWIVKPVFCCHFGVSQTGLWGGAVELGPCSLLMITHGGRRLKDGMEDEIVADIWRRLTLHES